MAGHHKTRGTKSALRGMIPRKSLCTSTVRRKNMRSQTSQRQTNKVLPRWNLWTILARPASSHRSIVDQSEMPMKSHSPKEHCYFLNTSLCWMQQQIYLALCWSQQSHCQGPQQWLWVLHRESQQDRGMSSHCLYCRYLQDIAREMFGIQTCLVKGLVKRDVWYA